jgi:hypothetical protein
MHTRNALILLVVLIALGLGLAPRAQADAVISTELLTPLDEIRTNRLIKFRVKVTSNDTGVPVHAVRFRVNYSNVPVNVLYNPDIESREELGDVGAGPAVLISGTDYYREFFTAPESLPTTPTELTPACFNVIVQMKNATLPPTFTITLSNDDIATPVLGTNGLPIAHTFDNSATTDIPTARVITTDWLSQTPFVPGGTLPVRISMQSNHNDAASIPTAANLRVFYDTNVVTWASATAGQLSSLVIGDEFTSPGSATYKYRDLSSSGRDFVIPTAKYRTTTQCRLTVPSGHGIVAGQTITVALNPPDVRFDGTFTVSSVAATYVYYLFSGVTVSNTATGGTIDGVYRPMPRICDIVFNVTSTNPIPPFSVFAEANPNLNGLEHDGTPLAHRYDSIRTRFTPQTVTELVAPATLTNLKVGDTFQVRLKTLNNDTGEVPVCFYTRLNYDGSFLDMTPPGPPSEGEVGPIRGSSMMGTSPNNYFDVYSDGYEQEFKRLFTKANPILATLTFKITALPTGPFDITLSDTTSWVSGVAGGLAERDQGLYMAHRLDSTATTGFQIQRVVATELMGDVIRPGDTFRVKVRVASNDTGASVPVACAFRVAYHGDAVSLESAAIGDLGAVNIGAPQGSGAGAYSDVSADLNQANTVSLATCYILTFRVKPNPVAPFSISLSDDPAAAVPLQGKGVGVHALPHVFNSSATQNLKADPIVITEWIDGDIMPGEQFKIRVRVLGNSGPDIPVSALFRVNFTSESLILLTPPPSSVLQSGTIGPPYAGPLNHDGGLGMAYRTIGTLGNTNNTELNPTCFIMTFEVKSAPVTPFSITLQAPASGFPLPAKGTYANIPHAYDSSRTTNLSTMTKPVVVTEVAAGSPQYIEGQFQVRVRVDSNDSFTTPGAAAFRVYYTTPSLTLMVAETQASGEGDLGAVSVGPEVGTATPGLVYREVWTAGNTANTNKLATCFLVTFAVGRDSVRPFDITVADTAMGGIVPLLGVDSTVLPHTFDSAETLGLGLPTIPPAGVREWQTLSVRGATQSTK